jgi:hypothetical protein
MDILLDTVNCSSAKMFNIQKCFLYLIRLLNIPKKMIEFIKVFRRVTRLVERRGRNIATVALANKLARIGWAVTVRGKSYQENYSI